MYHHVLIPTDGSELSNRAIAPGVALAKVHGARITALHVTAPFVVSVLAPIAAAADAAEQHRRRSRTIALGCLEVIANAAKAAGVPCDTVHAVDIRAYQAIIDTATSKGCDLIAMASHGRGGVSSIVLGSETLKVLTHSKIPVLVLR